MTLEYSKEVMKNFMNPKNLGEIKNADGIGKVGNPTCLLPKEKIWLNGTFQSINLANKEDLVLSHNGTANKIIGTFVREYNGKIVTIKSAFGEISLTPEHLVYALKLPQKLKFNRNKGKRTLTPSWFHAEDLRKGDIVLYSFPKDEKDLEKIELKFTKLKFDFRSKNLPKEIILNSDFLRLIGYFISEGNIQDKPTKTYISFALNIKEKEIVADLKNIVKNLFNLELSIKERPKEHGVICYIYNAHLARFFKKLFNNGAQNKYLPNFMMSLPPEKQKHIIYGLWKGDGYINLTRKGARAGYSTISYQLAQQLKILLLRQGIISSYYTEQAKIINGVNHQISYRIHIGQRDSLIKISKLFNIEYTPKSYQSVSSWIDKGVLYTPITSISQSDYSGKVYNLEVEDTHSFNSNAFSLHNCGDIMHLYIKVKKEKGKEIIKDIKFKTFGCAAAISTSSMVTQLAKGKTIQEAEKIKYEDVMKQLGGLPKVKVHCSMMAQEALKKAIKDYEKKKKIK